MNKEDRRGTGVEEVKDLMSQFMCEWKDEGRDGDEAVISVMWTVGNLRSRRYSRCEGGSLSGGVLVGPLDMEILANN